MSGTVSAKRAFYADATSKPKPLPLNVGGIPEEIRAVPCWVPWRFEWKADKDGGKWTKVPLSPKTLRRGDCNTRRDRGTLQQCMNAVQAGKADGVGFAFAGTGYIGFDLDDHRDLVTGELSNFAKLVMNTFPTYAEASPSATGIKLIGKGALPADAPRKVKELSVELFDKGYFAITGAAVPGAPAAVADLQPAINAHLADLLSVPSDRTKANTSKRGEATTGGEEECRRAGPPSLEDVEARVRGRREGDALMRGDTSAHRGDHSAADLALCNLIAFYAGPDPQAIDSVFRRSGLIREKWDHKHDAEGRTYGEMTVARAIKDKREFYDWSAGPKVVMGAGAGDTSPPVAEAPWPEMGADAYHGIAGEFVRLVEPNTEADPVALLVQLLTMFGSAAGKKAFVKVERSRHFANEFTVLVGRSAKGRKGTSEAWPTGVMQLADPDWEKNCRAGKLASGEALVWALRDAIYGMVDGEQQCIDEGVEDKRLLITEGEFSAILKIAAKESNTLSDQLRDAWDGKDLHNKSKGSPCKATAPHVSIIAHTNDSDLKMLLTENAMANGFANRFMFFAVRRSKSLPFGGKVDEGAFEEVAEALSQRLTYALSVGEITWSAEAEALWRAEYDRLSRDRYGLAGSLTGRAEAHALRLALLYALLDGVTEIDTPHLKAALAVWAYAEQTAYRLFGGRTGDPLADDLLRLLARHPGGIGRWALHQEAGKNIPAAKIGAALEALAKGGKVRSETQKTGGRDAEVWFPTSQ